MHSLASDSLRAKVTEFLATFTDPTLESDLVTLNAVHHVALMDDCLHIELRMPFAWNTAFQRLQSELNLPLKTATGAKKIDWVLHPCIATLKRPENRAGVKGVKNIIAVSSGKGGVGKSSIAVNLALALYAEGAKVGLLDADIYGPSIPMMLGTQDEHPDSPDGTHMLPIEVYGIATNSIGYLMSADNAAIWRGPMASKALVQLLNETIWPDVDYLILDMPPGTGDIQLTLAKNIPVTAAIVVTTPQNIALQDARRGMIMFEKVGVSLLGIVENMSHYICPHCGNNDPLFGPTEACSLREDNVFNILAGIPLTKKIREDLDKGTPTVYATPESPLTHIFCELASRVAAKLYWQGDIIPDDIGFRQM